MPVPGRQRINSINYAYWIAQHINWIRVIAAILLAWPVIDILKNANRWGRIGVGAGMIIYAVIFYMLHYKMEADAMFLQPSQKILANKSTNKVPLSKLVIGVVINGKAVAYPIQFIGYHHQVGDTVGGEPIIATYCTVCRTGRIYSSVVDGVPKNLDWWVWTISMLCLKMRVLKAGGNRQPVRLLRVNRKGSSS